MSERPATIVSPGGRAIQQRAVAGAERGVRSREERRHHAIDRLMHQNRPPAPPPLKPPPPPKPPNPPPPPPNPPPPPKPPPNPPPPIQGPPPQYTRRRRPPRLASMTNTTKSSSGRSEKSCELGARDATRGGASASVESVTPNAARDEAGERADAGQERRTVLLLGEQRAHDVPTNLAAGRVGDDPLEALPHLDPHVPGAGLVIDAAARGGAPGRRCAAHCRSRRGRRRPISARSPAPPRPRRWSSMVGSVTTVTSAPVALRRRVSRSSSSRARRGIDQRREVVDEAHGLRRKERARPPGSAPARRRRSVVAPPGGR